MSEISQVGRVTDYGLDDEGIRVQFPEGKKDFSHLYSIHTISGAHTASYKVSTTKTIYLGVKRLEHEADYQIPSHEKVKNGGCTPPFTPYIMMWCLINCRDNFTFYVLLPNILSGKQVRRDIQDAWKQHFKWREFMEKITLKMRLRRKNDVRNRYEQVRWPNLLVIGPTEDFCEHDNEPPDSIKVQNFLISWVTNFSKTILHHEFT